MKRYIKEGVKDFNLDHIFDCGQCFRWKKQQDGSYTGTAMGKTVNMDFIYDAGSDCSGTLIINGADEDDFQNIWKGYLDLDRDYGLIKEQLAAKDPVVAEAIEYGRGIRILRQDLWETIVSFIISQNNNIPRIRGCIEKLACQFGQGDAFPGPKVFAELQPEDLAEIKLGYRAPYIIKTSQQVLQQGFPENMEQLLSLQGVGPKVANCISLFGMGNLESFPVDVWVKRVMNRMYGFDEKDRKGMEKFAKENFLMYGGIAQQYLFYYIRQIEE